MKAEAKENIQGSLIETGKNLGSGVVGMVTGSALGRHSLWTGALTIFGGAWYQQNWVTSIGVGMIASNGFGGKSDDSTAGIDGFQDELTNAKERAISSLKALGKKVYLDKISPEMGEKLGLGELEDGDLIFLNGSQGGIGEFDTSEVDQIIHELEEGNANGLVEEDTFIEGAEDSLDLDEGEFDDQIYDEEFSGGDFTQEEELQHSVEDIGNIDILDLQGTDALELNATA